MKYQFDKYKRSIALDSIGSSGSFYMLSNFKILTRTEAKKYSFESKTELTKKENIKLFMPSYVPKRVYANSFSAFSSSIAESELASKYNPDCIYMQYVLELKLKENKNLDKNYNNLGRKVIDINDVHIISAQAYPIDTKDLSIYGGTFYSPIKLEGSKEFQCRPKNKSF